MTTDVFARSREIRIFPKLFVTGGVLTVTVSAARTAQSGVTLREVRPGQVYTGPSGDYVVKEMRWAKQGGIPTTTRGSEAWSVLEENTEQARGVDRALLHFAERIAAVPEVIAVSQAVEGRIRRIWTFILRRDKGVRRRVYFEELRVLEEFPEVQFDFNVVAFEDLLARGLVPDDLQGRIVFYRGDRTPQPPADA